MNPVPYPRGTGHRSSGVLVHDPFHQAQAEVHTFDLEDFAKTAENAGAAGVVISFLAQRRVVATYPIRRQGPRSRTHSRSCAA